MNETAGAPEQEPAVEPGANETTSNETVVAPEAEPVNETAAQPAAEPAAETPFCFCFHGTEFCPDECEYIDSCIQTSEATETGRRIRRQDAPAPEVELYLYNLSAKIRK